MHTLKKLVFLILVVLPGLAQSATTHSVTLAWDPSPDSAAGYNIYRSQTKGSYSTTPLNASPVSVACTAACTYIDSGLAPGTYFYVVRAVLNGVESVGSNEVITPVPASAPLNARAQSVQ